MVFMYYYRLLHYWFLILLFNSLSLYNNCNAQTVQSNNNSINPVISFNSLENNNEEQIIAKWRSEKIIHHLKLTKNEQELLIQIKQLENEANQCLNDAGQVAKEINEMNKILAKTEDSNDSHLKTERKIKRYENYELSLRFDAEELFEMSNSMLFNIYNDHFPTSIMLISKDNNYQQQINELSADAQELFDKSLKSQEKAYNNSNYQKGLDYLVKANFFKREALKKQEQSYALYYNIQSVIDKDKDLHALLDPGKSEMNENYDVEVQDDSLANNKSNLISCYSDSIDNSKNTGLPEGEREIYKVQIGAFKNPVDIRKFHGLSTLSVDSTDQKVYTKYMVGKYFSYNAACEAKRIIISTTHYEDAFIVAYKGVVRVPVDKTVNIPENMAIIKK